MEMDNQLQIEFVVSLGSGNNLTRRQGQHFNILFDLRLRRKLTRNSFSRVSTDRGKTWTRLCDVERLFWASVFPHRGAVYLLGSGGQSGSCRSIAMP